MDPVVNIIRYNLNFMVSAPIISAAKRTSNVTQAPIRGRQPGQAGKQGTVNNFWSLIYKKDMPYIKSMPHYID